MIPPLAIAIIAHVIQVIRFAKLVNRWIMGHICIPKLFVPFGQDHFHMGIWPGGLISHCNSNLTVRSPCQVSKFSGPTAVKKIVFVVITFYSRTAPNHEAVQPEFCTGVYWLNPFGYIQVLCIRRKTQNKKCKCTKDNFFHTIIVCLLVCPTIKFYQDKKSAFRISRDCS